MAKISRENTPLHSIPTETIQLRALPTWKGVLRRRDDDDDDDGGELTALKPVGDGEMRNPSLYQLLVFETALQSLRMGSHQNLL